MVVEQRFAEGDALAQVIGHVVDQPTTAELACGHGEALFLELLHLVDEAHVLFADAVALRNAHTVKEDLAGVGGMVADLANLVHLDARQQLSVLAQRHDDERLVLVAGAVAGVGEQADPVGLQGIGDPHLRAVDDVVITIFARTGLE